MDKNQAALWQRLLEYRFDKKDASFPYSAKVAKENGWNQAYAHRVIEEYRRFAFLAVAAGHPVSPPESVDQAWHVHILYTREYNDVFCARVLGTHLHHGPSIGGQKEDEKFQDWYSQTLMSYKTLFEEEPPKDIWPSAEQRALHKHNFERVDKESFWLIPRPSFVKESRMARAAREAKRRATESLHHSTHRSTAGCVLATVPVFLLAGCAAQNGAVNPLDYDGPSFLQFYIMSFIVGTTAAAIVRHAFRPPNSDGSVTRRLDAAETAYLNGGPELVMHSALAALMQQNLVSIKARSIVRTADPEPTHLTSVEKTLLRSTGQTGVWAKDLTKVVATDVDAIKTRLQVEGLVMEDEAASRNVLAGWLVGLVVPLLGIAKVVVGASREKPVTFLVILLVISALILGVAIGRKKWRSRKGDAVLASLQATQAGYKQVQTHTNASPADYAMAVALFGVPALAGTAIYDQMRPINQAGSGSYTSTGCGSSCSSSSSSGGESGGGGGCGGGGGGCGGCGGGD